MERSLRQRPPAAPAPDQARLDIVASGEREELGAAQQATKVLHGLPHQQGLFLPMPAQEGRRAQSAEKLSDRGIDHPRIITAAQNDD